MRNEIPEGYVRVSDVLQPYANFAGIEPEVLANAADRGTRTHTFCELYARNLLIEEPDEDCKPYVESFKEWFDNVVLRVEETELRINDPELFLSGQVDMIATIKGDPTPSIIDIKTPQKESASWRLQTAAYLWLYKRNGRFPIHRRVVVQLSKQGRAAKLLHYLNDDIDIIMFRKAYDLYRYFNGGKNG